MKIAIGADHAGFPLKQALIDAVRRTGHQAEEFPAFELEEIDFPDVVLPVCLAIRDGRADRALLVCGTGIGACMAANKVDGIRAALCHDVHSAHQSVEHDDANVMCLGAKIVGEWLAVDLVEAFLAARFGGEDHFQRRIEKMTEIERMNF